MIFESTINFEPVSLKRHRHRLKGGTYDPSKKDKDDFIKTIENFPEEKMTKPIRCILNFLQNLKFYNIPRTHKHTKFPNQKTNFYIGKMCEKIELAFYCDRGGRRLEFLPICVTSS